MESQGRLHHQGESEQNHLIDKQRNHESKSKNDDHSSDPGYNRIECPE